VLSLLTARVSMVVLTTYIVRRAVLESKRHAILVVDPNTVAPLLITLQRLEPIAGRHPQVFETGRRVYEIQFPSDDRPNRAIYRPLGLISVPPSASRRSRRIAA
jgi:hypothetical protein